MSFYQKDQVFDIETNMDSNNSILIKFSPLMETLYSCPGAILKREGNGIYLNLVRCGIKSKCDVDITATLNSDEPGSYIISVPETDKLIYFVFGEELQQIWPR
jgi:hypothetical protein